jgi:hypothetical protein
MIMRYLRTAEVSSPRRSIQCRRNVMHSSVEMIRLLHTGECPQSRRSGQRPPRAEPENQGCIALNPRGACTNSCTRRARDVAKATGGRQQRGGWKMEEPRRIGRPHEGSSTNEDRGASKRSRIPSVAGWSFSDGPAAPAGVSGGGKSREGLPEQFGPWHGASIGAAGPEGSI